MAKQSAIVTGLKKARRLIAKEGGWIQHFFTDGHGGYCAAGAVHKAFPGGSRIGEARIRARCFLKDSLPRTGPMYNLMAYNDTPRRTQAQIVKLFDRAIARAEKDLHDRRTV